MGGGPGRLVPEPRRASLVGLLAMALALGCAGCGNQEGSLAGYAPEGVPGTAFTLVDVVLSDLSSTNSRFTLWVNNVGPGSNAYVLEASTDPSFGSLTLPAGWTVVFRDSTNAPITSTQDLLEGEAQIVYAEVTVPIVEPAGQVSLYFRVRSPIDGSEDILHDQLTVSVASQTHRAIGRGREETGGAAGNRSFGGGVPVVDLTNNARLPGAPGEGPGPEPSPVVSNTITLGPNAVCNVSVLDSSTANGYRFYYNPADQGYRPGSDYITRPAGSTSLGWSQYNGEIDGFLPQEGNWIEARGARNGVENSAAPVSRPAYVPPASPVELAQRSIVPILGPKTPPDEPDNFPPIVPPVTLSWQEVPGASSYVVQVFGRTGLYGVAYTGGAVGDTGPLTLEAIDIRAGQVYFWFVFALDAEHRVVGVSTETGSFQVVTPPGGPTSFPGRFILNPQPAGSVTSGVPTFVAHEENSLARLLERAQEAALHARMTPQ